LAGNLETTISILKIFFEQKWVRNCVNNFLWSWNSKRKHFAKKVDESVLKETNLYDQIWWILRHFVNTYDNYNKINNDNDNSNRTQTNKGYSISFIQNYVLQKALLIQKKISSQVTARITTQKDFLWKCVAVVVVVVVVKMYSHIFPFFQVISVERARPQL